MLSRSRVKIHQVNFSGMSKFVNQFSCVHAMRSTALAASCCKLVLTPSYGWLDLRICMVVLKGGAKSHASTFLDHSTAILKRNNDNKTRTSLNEASLRCQKPSWKVTRTRLSADMICVFVFAVRMLLPPIFSLKASLSF